MVAGLPVEDIESFFEHHSPCVRLVEYYGDNFNCSPNCYVNRLIEADYTGTMTVVKELLNERSKNGSEAIG